MEESASRHTPWFIFAAILAAIGLCAGVGGLSLAGQAYGQHYAGRIYPGVSVYGVDLGGLTVDEAAAALQAALPAPSSLPLTLRDGDRVWSRSWADLGIRFAPQATARLAYQAGREGTAQQQYAAQLRAIVAGWPLSPVVLPRK